MVAFQYVCFSNVCSVGKEPAEPKLVEWTERANKFDRCRWKLSREVTQQVGDGGRGSHAAPAPNHHLLPS